MGVVVRWWGCGWAVLGLVLRAVGRCGGRWVVRCWAGLCFVRGLCPGLPGSQRCVTLFPYLRSPAEHPVSPAQYPVTAPKHLVTAPNHPVTAPKHLDVKLADKKVVLRR